MDVVITYVDGRDPVWKKDYEEYTKVPVLEKRFRDWGTLKYLLRGIETNMPFVRNVHLVVSHPSQVPQWIDTDQVKVVLHKDIIPPQHLPTFNSTTIEMFLHKIDGLDEQYLYFNDDMFPIMQCKKTDFYRNGKALLGMRRALFATGLYKKQCRNSDALARKAAGLKPSFIFVRPQHICSPMLKSLCEDAYEKMDDTIHKSISALREAYNLNQYFYLDYMFHNQRLINHDISNRHFSTSIASADSICSFIKNPDKLFCCINDVQMSEDKFTLIRDAIVKAFEERFPDKSRFEK